MYKNEYYLSYHFRLSLVNLMAQAGPFKNAHASTITLGIYACMVTYLCGIHVKCNFNTRIAVWTLRINSPFAFVIPVIPTLFTL